MKLSILVKFIKSCERFAIFCFCFFFGFFIFLWGEQQLWHMEVPSHIGATATQDLRLRPIPQFTASPYPSPTE